MQHRRYGQAIGIKLGFRIEMTQILKERRYAITPQNGRQRSVAIKTNGKDCRQVHAPGASKCQCPTAQNHAEQRSRETRSHRPKQLKSLPTFPHASPLPRLLDNLSTAPITLLSLLLLRLHFRPLCRIISVKHSLWTLVLLIVVIIKTWPDDFEAQIRAPN